MLFLGNGSHRELQHDLPNVPFSLGSAFGAVGMVADQFGSIDARLNVALVQ